ncbi:phosphatase PAP2 family protein [Streptomyces sp. NPDC001307]|uniref:phosphatase PAP2 family protein n=1 Tax=Streptomyces sp. NPDC001307 TaxID=3364560 RepID=UPI003683635E
MATSPPRQHRRGSTRIGFSALPPWLRHRFGANRARRRTAVVSAVGVGVTRVWLGVHRPSDVLGGWLFGTLVTALAVVAYEWPRARHANTAVDRPG